MLFFSSLHDFDKGSGLAARRQTLSDQSLFYFLSGGSRNSSTDIREDVGTILKTLDTKLAILTCGMTYECRSRGAKHSPLKNVRISKKKEKHIFWKNLFNPEVNKAINSLSFSNFKIVDTEATKKQNGKSFVRTFDNDKNE